MQSLNAWRAGGCGKTVQTGVRNLGVGHHFGTGQPFHNQGSPGALSGFFGFEGANPHTDELAPALCERCLLDPVATGLGLRGNFPGVAAFGKRTQQYEPGFGHNARGARRNRSGGG